MDVLTYSLDYESKVPLYHQLYSFIKADIQSGSMPFSTKLPSKRKLSSYLRISQNTVQSAYNQLIEEGYIISKERKGYYVNKIDHLQNIYMQPDTSEDYNKRSKMEAKFDFSYHGVDKTTFPYAVWRKLMKETINECDPELLQLGDSLGYYRLRTVIAQYLHQSRGVNCNENQIIISSGTEVLYQTLIQLFDEDTIFGIENPGYEKLNQLFISNRANFKSINIDRNGMIPEEVYKSNANILCITPSHQFPSGEIMPINRRLQILNWANKEGGRYLIEDDYDSEFKYSTRPIPSLQSLDNNEKVIYMGSFSKSLSPTIRISYMVLPPHLMRRYNKNLSYILCPVPIFEQKVLYRFIQDGYFERHLNKMRNIYKKKREVLVKAITELNCGIQILGADAGLHLLIRIPNNMSEEQLIHSALRQGVRVYGISGYYFDKENIGVIPTIMLGYAEISEEEIVKAVKLLHKAWFE
ncbi:MocR-like pyridoxine biosynthesis transcription factor PdxR [Xylanivirga thermophila]|jgi:GntR family transcriptional regulator / MocR family aminotransferase|uniref:MocR-like pyridoxine biosynthesis transcription factor PdxR n=1 Tax=Xylanivirga thermophila TaxID=2496273 RepID=UPI00101CCDC0|nr:PLP-dependent aminotransferase family protein [Xylanivirga thermophila]